MSEASQSSSSIQSKDIIIVQIQATTIFMDNNPNSKRWVDYSDSDEPEQFSPAGQSKSPPAKPTKITRNSSPPSRKRYVPSKSKTNKQLDLLDRLDDQRIDEVWMEIFSENGDYLQKQMAIQGGRAKKGGDIVKVTSSEDPRLYHVLTYIDKAYEFIKKGYDRDDFIDVTVSDRNFGKGSKNGARDRDQEGRKYVEKSEKGKFQRPQQNRYKPKKETQPKQAERSQEKPEKPKQEEREERDNQSNQLTEAEKREKRAGKEKKKKKEPTSKYASKNPFESLEDV